MGGPARSYSDRARYGRSFGPRLAFFVAIAIAFAVLGSGAWPANDLVAAASTVLFVLAAALAFVAWLRRNANEGGVTYWDAAGALTLIAICAAATIDPDQLARLMESQNVK